MKSDAIGAIWGNPPTREYFYNARSCTRDELIAWLRGWRDAYHLIRRGNEDVSYHMIKYVEDLLEQIEVKP